GLGLARALHGLGLLADAQAVAVEASKIEARILPWRRWDTSTALLDVLAVSKGEPGALDRLQAGAARMDPHLALSLHAYAATWMAQRDGARRAADVERALDAAWSASSVAACPRCSRELLVASAELMARIGRIVEARAALARWEAGYDGPPYPARTLWQ